MSQKTYPHRNRPELSTAHEFLVRRVRAALMVVLSEEHALDPRSALDEVRAAKRGSGARLSHLVAIISGGDSASSHDARQATLDAIDRRVLQHVRGEIPLREWPILDAATEGSSTVSSIDGWSESVLAGADDPRRGIPLTARPREAGAPSESACALTATTRNEQDDAKMPMHPSHPPGATPETRPALQPRADRHVQRSRRSRV